MPGTPGRLYGPAYIANSATNIYNPSANTYALVRQIHISNKDTSSAYKFTLYVGATGGSAGGTEISGGQHSVAAGAEADLWFPSGLKLVAADFLTGLADAASKLTVVIIGELYAV
jgi:hypothetical protein